MQLSGVVAITAVAGMGGVGKTELATQYARLHEKDYPGGICWLSARDSDLAASIVQFAQLHMNLEVLRKDGRGRVLSLTEQVKWCWQHWQPPEGLALIVLDNIQDLKSCQKLLPRSNRFRVLLTTRARNLDPNIEEISLNVLLPQEALELLTALVGQKRVQKELEVVNQLCEWLGYLPLGLELVGRYLLEDPDLSFTKMLQRLKEQSLLDEAVNPSQSQLQDTEMTAKRGVKAAFELSWVELDSRTQDVGRLLSLFAPDVIPWELVDYTSQLLSWAETDVIKAKKQLHKRHLIEEVTERQKCYKIHPLIREFLRNKFAEPESGVFFAWIRDVLKTKKLLRPKITRAFATAMVAIAQKIPSSPTLQLITSVKDAIPHLAEVAQNLIDAVGDENLIWVFVGLSRFYFGQGLYALAEPWDKQCVSVVQSRLGEEHPHVASSINNLAALYLCQGRYAEAEPLYQQALALRRSLLGEEHPDVATSLYNLAYLYDKQGRYVEAEPLYQQALALGKRLLGEEHPDVAISLNNLANLYSDQGRYAEAEPLLQQALALTRLLLGEEHPDVATSLNGLAYLYDKQGRYAEAEPLYQQALVLYRRLLGEEHPDVATSLNNLANLYLKNQGRYAEAEPLLQQALALRRSLLGEEHPDVATSLNSLAYLYLNQGQYAEAEPLLQQALALRRSLLGEEHPDVATSLNSLAVLYDQQGQYAEAESLYQQALALGRRLLGEEHPDVATSLYNLAYLYDKQGRYVEAELLYQQALVLYRRLLGEEHPLVATSLNSLADLYLNQGRYAEAEPLLQQALALRRSLLGEEHPDVATSLNSLAYLYLNQGQYAKAELLYKKALEIAELSLGVDHPNTILIRKNYADFLHSYANFLRNKQSVS